VAVVISLSSDVVQNPYCDRCYLTMNALCISISRDRSSWDCDIVWYLCLQVVWIFTVAARYRHPHVRIGNPHVRIEDGFTHAAKLFKHCVEVKTFEAIITPERSP
jgi:hypothetical protein